MTTTETTTIRLSSVAEVLGAGSLVRDHWQEVALNKGLMALRPDVDRYEVLERAGMLFILAAVAGSEIVGYSVNIVDRHLHYSDLTVCSNDVLFVAKSARSGGLGPRLILRTEKEAKARGAQMMLWHAKPTPELTLKDLLPKMGYGVQDILFSKEI